jgi:hypothetical protein
MGRTVIPFNQVVEQTFQRWAKFRRALRKEDQEAFDALLGAAKFHVPAGVYASDLNPTELIFLSLLLEHQKTLDALQARRAPAVPDPLPTENPRAAPDRPEPPR